MEKKPDFLSDVPENLELGIKELRHTTPHLFDLLSELIASEQMATIFVNQSKIEASAKAEIETNNIDIVHEAFTKTCIENIELNDVPLDEFEDFYDNISHGRKDDVLTELSNNKVLISCPLTLNNETLLHVAAAFNQISIFKSIISLGGDCKIKNKAGEIPLHIACREGAYDIVKYYVDSQLASINECSTDGWTALFYSAVNGYIHIASYLIAHNADVNLVDFIERTVLHWAAEFNQPDIIKLLLKNNCDEKMRDVDGRTAYELAKVKGSKECIEVFERHKQG